MTSYRHHFKLLLLMLWIPCVHSYAADLILLHSPKADSRAWKDVELAARFYGLNLRDISTSEINSHTLAAYLKPETTVGFVISADALPAVDRQEISHSLRRETGVEVPVLVLAIDANTDPAAIRSWSAGHVLASACSTTRFTNGSYRMERQSSVTRQLAGTELPFRSQETCYFAVDHTEGMKQIAAVSSIGGSVPVFVKAATQGRTIFLSSRILQSAAAAPEEVLRSFLPRASAFLFVRFAAGERGWHSPAPYANLTIDDPWLRDSYGYLNYAGLLREEQTHNFHSTIAFIPWNYDRSRREVSSLFRDHPDRLSICIHGNDHDHKEFTSFEEKPFATQSAALRQAVARMQQFRTLTGIPYDEVMVFPHSIAPEATLAELRKQNFLATVNSTNVPQDSPQPLDPVFPLRTATLSFANFPSLVRYSVEAGPVSPALLAVNAFLGNPLLLYCHQGFFASGMDAFDKIADQINRGDPSTQWRSLGDIARHLYLLRARDNLGYDVQAFSSDFFLENPAETEALYYIQKADAGRAPIEAVTVDGLPYPYEKNSDGRLSLEVGVQGHASRHVHITYLDGSSLAKVDIGRRSPRAAILRLISDFRDIELSTNPFGNAVVSLYYKRPFPAAAVLVFFTASIAALAVVLKAAGRKKALAMRIHPSSIH